MRAPRTLQVRLALGLGLMLTLCWVGAAWVTAVKLRAEMDEVFDSSLQETAQRILPLAVVDILGREDEGITQRLAAIRDYQEYFTYIVTDRQGRILVQSHSAEPATFPPYDGPGFRQTATHRLYNEQALRGSIRISVAEPLSHRAHMAREVQIGLGLPLLVVIPLTLAGVVLAVRRSLAPVRRFGAGLAARGAHDLSPVAAAGLPAEIAPLADTLNGLLARLKAAFEAERSFAANAAHEIRTPLAGAIAQAQRLQSETADPAVARRAADIEGTLKRLTRLAERLMQLARAEGGRLRTDTPADLRPVLRIVADDVGRAHPGVAIALTLPDAPVLSDIDPDTCGILCRNLIENALRHGTPGTPVEVSLAADGTLRVANDCAVVPPDVLARLTGRFERANATVDGSGLGLAIVTTILRGLDGRLDLYSPRRGQGTGFEAVALLPLRPPSPQGHRA